MSFVGLYTGLSGIRAAQTGLDITSHNIANSSTPGYTRQRVEQAASPAYQSLGGMVGTGASVTDIARLRDPFLDARYRSAVGDHAEATTRADFLASLEHLGGEPDHGISARMARLWTAAESWANDPADNATRAQVLTELESITDAIRATATAWDQLGEDTAAQRETVADMATQALASLAELDNRLANANPDRIDPGLYDQRDALLDEVAKLTGATVSYVDGRPEVSLGGVTLLSKGQAGSIGLGEGDLEGQMVAVSHDGQAQVVTAPGDLGGELGGLHRVLTQDLPKQRAELDAFAEALAGQINDLGLLADDAPLLTLDGAGGATAAAGIGVTGGVRAGDLVATDSGQAHGAEKARGLADLRTGGIEAQLADLVVGLAGDVRASKATAQGARGIANGADLARTSEHGVNLDEEMIGLVRYQRALEASARVMTTVDEALNVLVNRTGIVGR